MHESDTSSASGTQRRSIEHLLDQATAAIDEAVGSGAASRSAKPFQLDDLSDAPETTSSSTPIGIDLLGEVELDLRIELGRTEMSLQEVLQLRGGSVVALDSLVGDPVSVYVNGRIVAKGEILVMDDNFCVRVTELVGA